MGRASDRKKVRRQPAHPARRAVTVIQAQARSQLALLTGLDYLSRAIQKHDERYIAARTASRPEFPVLDGPASLLGRAVLGEVTKALISDQPAAEELAVLSRALDGTIPGVAGSVVAGAMIDAARLPDLRELPAEVLRRSPPIDNPLEILVAAGVIAPGDELRAGLSILAALIRMGESELASPRRHAA